DDRGDQGWITQRCERDPPDSVRVMLRCLGRGLKRQPGLSCATRAGERHEANVVPSEEPGELLELGIPAEERGCRNRQADVAETSQRRMLGGTQLVHPFGCGEVFESMLAEIAQFDAHECRGRGRDKHLSAIGGRGYARRSMDVCADVALVRDERRT